MISLLINDSRLIVEGKEIKDFRIGMVEVSRTVPPPVPDWIQPYRRSRRRGGGTTYYDIYGGVVFASRGSPLIFTFTYRSDRNGRGCQSYSVPQDYFAASSRVRYHEISISDVPACFTTVQATECHLIVEYVDGSESNPIIFPECPKVEKIDCLASDEVCDAVVQLTNKINQLVS